MSINYKKIIDLFNEEQSIQQIKSLKNQLKNLEIQDNNINSNSISESIITNEQTILSIISNNIPDKIHYFINGNDNSFNYESFLYVLIEIIKKRLCTITNHSKSIENSLFHKINKNTIKKIQSIIINFLISFYDFYENNPSFKNVDDAIKAILDKNIVLEDSFLISCIIIVLKLNLNINKEKYKNFFNENIKDYYSLIKEVISLLIKLLNILIIIKKNKESFQIQDNTIIDNDNLKNNKGYYNYKHFEIFINKVYKKNELFLVKLLYGFFFNNKLHNFFHFIKNDEYSKILLDSLSFEKDIRIVLMKMLNKSLLNLEKHNKKELLKIIKSNNAITKILNYISEDLKNKLYNEISQLLQEFKILFIFSLLIHLEEINIEKVIIQLLTSNIELINNDKNCNQSFYSFINELYDICKNMPKYKYTILNFILLIFESIKNARIAISKIFFKNINGNLEEYLEITQNANLNFNLFLNNLNNSEAEVINNYFNFLYTLDRNEYLPSNEIMQILSQLNTFNNVNATKSLIENLKIFTDIDYLMNNKDNDIYTIEKENEDFNPENNLKNDENLDRYQTFIKSIYQDYINILFNIILDIKENFNSLQHKSPFDIDVTVSSIINTNYSNITEEDNNKKVVSSEILNILLDYLKIILNDKQMFQNFISIKFLDFFSSLVKDNNYKQIAYKLIKIYFKSPNNNDKNSEKNKQQILMVLNRFYKLFSKDNKEIENIEKKYDEINKLKEFILIQDIFKIYFKKNLIKIISENDKKMENLNGKIINFYIFYSEYIIENSKDIYLIYNDEYHLLIKKYLNNIIKLICISNHNIITKNNNYSPNHLKKIFKSIINNVIKFYSIFPEDDNIKKFYFLDIIKYFIDKSINFEISKNKNQKNIQIQKDERLSEEDFTSFYIDKYRIDKDLLEDNIDNKNKSIISNFCIQSPLFLLSLLKALFKYNKYLGQYLNFILFLCKINQQNILFLLSQNLLKILFNILKEVPSFYIQIFQIFSLCFKYLSKENICFIFENLIKLSNNNSSNKNNKEFIKEILHYITNSLRILSIPSNDYFKGIILSKFKIRQPNTYNMLEINNLNFYDEKNLDKKNNTIILVKQEIYFYKSLKAKKLLLLRLEKQKDNIESEQCLEETKNKNLYLEISFRNLEIFINENDDQLKYDDLSNYNSIFIDNDNKKTDIENHLDVNKNNEIIYIFKEDIKILTIYINGHKVITFKYNFNFEKNIKIKIGFPLDLVKETKMDKFKLYNHIKIKSLRIFLQNPDTKEIEKNIYQLSIRKISCDYLFADELTNFKFDENTKLISAYNNLYSAIINSIFHKNFIKLQFYKTIFFADILIINSLDYIFRLEKFIFILLNYPNIDKIIFNELISLLCTYLIINENFLQKFLAKEEFNSSLYFSLYRNAKFIDKETIETLLSLILINNKNSNKIHNYIILQILLDNKLFDSMTQQTKNDLITSINNIIIRNNQNNINKSLLLEKLTYILILCQFNNKNDTDELLINIIFELFEKNTKDEKILNIIEELIYILFHFDKYTSTHLSSYKNGRLKETFKIIYEYFKKIYNRESIEHIHDLILKKLEPIILVTQYKTKLNRLISLYVSPMLIDVNINKNDLVKNNNNIASKNILSIEEEDDEEDGILFRLPSISYQKIRSNSFSFHEQKSPIIKISKAFTGRINKKKMTVNAGQTKLLFNKNKKASNKKLSEDKNDYDLNDSPANIFQFRQQSSIRPFDDVILFKGVINQKKRKSLKYLFKRKIEKKRNNIVINISKEDKEECVGDCHLCQFIKKILISLFKREIQFGIYKNYLLHCLTEVFIMNKNLDFKYSFSYYLMKREGPNRIRKKFNIRIDKLLNSEYDRSAFVRRNIKKENNSNIAEKGTKNNNTIIKEKSIEINNKELINENEYEKLFMFYENKKFYISENLLNFYNLGQIYNIDIVTNIVDFDDKFQYAFNCLLFKGFSYINGVLVLGKNKIYLLSTVNISSSNILYDAHFPITKRFWVVKKHNEILKDQCKYLSSFDDFENGNDLSNNNQNKKKLFEKTLKGFWLYSFYYVEINEIHKRKFLHQNNAIEIFLKNGKNYYLAVNLDMRDKLVKYIINNIKYSHQSKNASFFFNDNSDQTKNGQDILEEKNINTNEKNDDINDNLNNMAYEIQNESLIKSDSMIFMLDSNLFLEKSKKNKENNFYRNFFQNKKKYTLGTITDINEILDKSYDKWTNGYLNTYSYIMILNTISGRTYNDIAQYPIYPWIISDYSTNELDLTDPKSYRDFMYPIYAQDEETRENLRGKYEAFEEEQKEYKYHSGSHYSNAGFVCYYLIRIKPFSQLAAEVQGEFFDTPDRLFFNIEGFFKVSEKYQELIPDVFNLPEIYINSNNFYFGLNSDKKNINNVLLPSWASYSPRLFCKILRKSLESQFVSMNINNWIDLIFGYKQKGSEGEKFCNILRNVCSNFNPKKDCEDDNEMEQKINELCELGINPKQLFNKSHHKRERHQKMKAFFGRNIYIQYFKPKDEEYLLKNLENHCVIKEMNKYYENSSEFLSKGEGGLSSFKMCYEEDNDYNNTFEYKESNNNLIYFIVTGKKVLLPPSYKNYIQWTNNNQFHIIKPFRKKKYEFTIHHMKNHSINYIKTTKNGSFIIIGYSNGVIEKYKLIRMWGPKNKENKDLNENKDINKSNKSSLTSTNQKAERAISNDENAFFHEKETYHLEKIGRPKEKSVHVKGGLFNSLFGAKKRKNTQYAQYRPKKEINEYDDEEENKQIIESMEKHIKDKNINKTSFSNDILFDTHIPISTSNIINSDCIFLNNNMGKFIQYNGLPSAFEDFSKKSQNENDSKNENSQINIPGYDIYSNNKKYLANIISKENHNSNSLFKHYIIFLINSSSRILSEISLIEICESYSLMLVIDKLNNLYIYDFNSFDLIKYVNCSIYFKSKIKFISICPYTGDFILASYYNIVLMSINGVFITQMNNFKSRLNYCFINSIYQSNSDLYLFSAHEDGNLLMSKLINNFNGSIFNMSKSYDMHEEQDKPLSLLTTINIKSLHDKYDPIRIQNISDVYHIAFDTKPENKNKEKFYKYLENSNNFSLVFDMPIEIKCCQHPIKYMKLSEDKSALICINSKNQVIYLDYQDFFKNKKKNKDKKNMVYCEKCQNIISSFKTLCQICGKKLCSDCKNEKIIPECSLKNPKPICDECSKIITKNEQNLFTF